MKPTRLRAQTVAFAVIMLASLGLYASAQAGVTAATWVLVILTIAAMLLALWAG